MDDHTHRVRCGCEWCGLCYESVRCRRATRGHLRYRSPRRAKELPVVSYLRREESSNGDGAHMGGPGPGEWGVLYPALFEFLSANTWSDGAARLPGSLTLFTDGALWKCCLNDKAQERVCFVTGMSVDHLFSSLEEGLVSGGLDWRTTRHNSQKRR